MKQLTIIVAVSDNGAIGKENRLLWHLPDDLKRFKRLTEDHTIIMGMNTYLSLPKRPLPRRRHIVLSHKTNLLEGCLLVSSVEEAILFCEDDKENFIIGGASIYQQFLPFVNKIQYTRVHASFDGDTFFPVLNQDQWILVEEECHSGRQSTSICI